MKINFIELSPDYCHLLHEWFQKPLVKKWYARGENWSLEKINNKYFSKLDETKEVFRFIIKRDAQPIGFMQYYLLTSSLPDSIDDYNSKLFDLYKAHELAGIDFFLCDEYQNQGLGTHVLKQFIDNIIPKSCKAVVTDPLCCNHTAIKTLEKIGFGLYQKAIDKSHNVEICVMIKILA